MANEIADAADDLGGQAELARKLVVSSVTVNQWVSGARPVPAQHAAAIERISGGRWAVEKLCPQTRWVRVKDSKWPHPDGRPLIDPVKVSA
jgi:DNA-binding transcriptional regulator YdaS (Cro superfamily)